MQVREHANQPVPGLADICEAAIEAGKLAQSHLARGTESWTKTDGSPVSDADMAVDALLKQRLLALRPDCGWLSEETVDAPERLSARDIWIVDPIDGTRAFLKGSPNWCVAISLVREGRPVLAAVYAPASDDLYAASLGGGATLNGKTISASRRSALEGCRIIAHRSVLRPERWRVPFPHVELGMTTSLVLRMCLVASGQFDAALSAGSKSDWDLAPGDLIAHEAGGFAFDLNGREMIYNRRETRQHGMVAAAPGLRREMVMRSKNYTG